MLFVYYIPLNYVITSLLSCVVVSKVYFSNILCPVHMTCHPILLQEDS